MRAERGVSLLFSTLVALEAAVVVLFVLLGWRFLFGCVACLFWSFPDPLHNCSRFTLQQSKSWNDRQRPELDRHRHKKFFVCWIWFCLLGLMGLVLFVGFVFVCFCLFVCLFLFVFVCFCLFVCLFVCFFVCYFNIKQCQYFAQFGHVYQTFHGSPSSSRSVRPKIEKHYEMSWTGQGNQVTDDQVRRKHMIGHGRMVKGRYQIAEQNWKETEQRSEFHPCSRFGRCFTLIKIFGKIS